MTDRFLDKVYAARTADETRGLYDRWAGSYEAEVAENGYATPARCAEALRIHAPDPSVPVLDFGCGTGLSGLALRLQGFSTIDGVDLSPGMLAEARAKDVYRSLTPIGPGDPPPGGYALIAAIGVIGAGAAPLEVLDRLVASLPPGGLCVFSFNSHTLEDPRYEARVAAYRSDGIARECFRADGPHLPGRGITATVYVLSRE